MSLGPEKRGKVYYLCKYCPLYGDRGYQVDMSRLVCPEQGILHCSKLLSARMFVRQSGTNIGNTLSGEEVRYQKRRSGQ